MNAHTECVARVPEGLNANGVKRDNHPVWYPPTNSGDHRRLHVLNSLTETVEPFAPKDGRLVR
jgi:cysteinyl-tRNA synthetase